MAKATARHILVDNEATCNDLKTQIESGTDFGEFGPGQMVREFDEVVFAGELNKVHGPVKTQFGYHLLEITSRSE